jgi:hypothetical protein
MNYFAVLVGAAGLAAGVGLAVLGVVGVAAGCIAPTKKCI